MFAEVIQQGVLDVGAPYGFEASCSCGSSPHGRHYYMFTTPYTRGLVSADMVL